MLKLHTLAAWMHGFLDPERPYGLPEDVYNDVIPSGVHNFNRSDPFLKPSESHNPHPGAARKPRTGVGVYFAIKERRES